MYNITKAEFKKLTDYIKRNYGINIIEEKESLITGRLSNLLIQKNISSFSDYYNYVVSDITGDAAVDLINKITTNHTFFMREADHFDFFKNKVLPYLSNSVGNKDLRIWSAGCSSGQEPYTLAMILDEYFGKDKIWWDTKILATDISAQALSKAKMAVYSNEEINMLPSYWKMNYLNKFDGDNYVISEKIKKEIIFRKLNFMDTSFPFKHKFHTIFCRNVMIYFDNETKCKLVNKFYDLLENGGYLFIGHSESLNREETKFKYIMPAIYRKE